MVAPTRTPQARGVKCGLCKKILAAATWLDQTKLAKCVEDAQSVLDLIVQHQASDCPCIPKSIENLLVGSTHFEIHRLVAKRLDAQIHKRQYEHFLEAKQKAANELSKNKNENINDCYDTRKMSRFKIYASLSDQKHSEQSKQQLKHLCKAIDFWVLALEDQANPFNSKLALRLGLTHHVIYACYLFKYYKIFDYQLLTANLLLNLFKSIEGVTANAVSHANYLLVKTLMDCNQHQLARQCLKQATKTSNYQDKSHYESILLTCVSCELSLLENDGDSYNILDDLAKLAVIQPDDKLQHYYARTLAVSIIIKYIHCYPARSTLCFEFYHTYRYICAIIRRCYANSFELVLSEKDPTKQQQQQPDTPSQNQILDHSWIRFAVCDFVFSTFDLLSNFYIRTGQPENLELLYNGLNLVAYRNGSCYWQTRMASIGASLDLLCDKYDHARAKLDVISRVIGHTSEPHLMNILRLDSEVSLLALLDRQETVIKREVVMDLLQRIKTCHASSLDRICKIELYDCKSNTSSRPVNSFEHHGNNLIVLRNDLSHLCLKSLKIATHSMLRAGDLEDAKDLITRLGAQLISTNCQILEYHDCQTISEILLCFADIDRSEYLLLEAISSSHLFLETESDLATIESQLSALNITTCDSVSTLAGGDEKRKPTKTTKSKVPQLSLGRRSKRRGVYDVAGKSEKNQLEDHQSPVRFFDTIEAIKNFSSLSTEEMVVSYLRNSEPCPDYLLYRKAHEMMFCFRLKDAQLSHDQLLYHFCESTAANTVRYRWMMFEEQQAAPYGDSSTTNEVCSATSTSIKTLGFNNVLVNLEKTIKSLVRGIPEDYRLLQLKYILDKRNLLEHLLIVSFDHGNEPIYVHVHKPLAIISGGEKVSNNGQTFDQQTETTPTLPNKLFAKVEEAKRALFLTNQRSRKEKREMIEKEIEAILQSLENDWLSAFRFLLCGKTNDLKYNNFVQDMVGEFQSTMGNSYSCNSSVALRLLIENGPLLSRDEFCRVLTSLFNCPPTCNEKTDCFNKWLKSMEAFVASRSAGHNKTTFIQNLARGQVGLILDRDLELIPFESLPITRITKQPIFRALSLRILNVIVSRSNQTLWNEVDSEETAYILDPACNLGKTRARFESKLRAQKTWLGTISQPPTGDQLEQWLTKKQVYMFIGHGAGSAYYNRLCKGRGLGAMPLVRPLSLVMGCSSGRVLAEGPRLESFGIGWVFVLRGAPAYVGLLWDVTDTDIDRFLNELLALWMGPRWCGDDNLDKYKTSAISVTDAVARARQVCHFVILVGSTPVVYGLPVSCKRTLPNVCE